MHLGLCILEGLRDVANVILENWAYAIAVRPLVRERTQPPSTLTPASTTRPNRPSNTNWLSDAPIDQWGRRYHRR